MWLLIVLASLVLVLSLTANWVQRETLNTDEVVNTTDEILEDEDVQQALATYTVEQLYANVDVQAEIEKKLPAPPSRSRFRSRRRPGSWPPTWQRGLWQRLRFRISSPPRSTGRTGSS